MRCSLLLSGYMIGFDKWLKLYLGDVELAVIDTSNVRLNLVGKRVQISEDAEHFHRHTSKKLGIVHVQGKTID